MAENLQLLIMAWFIWGPAPSRGPKGHLIRAADVPTTQEVTRFQEPCVSPRSRDLCVDLHSGGPHALRKHPCIGALRCTVATRHLHCLGPDPVSWLGDGARGALGSSQELCPCCFLFSPHMIEKGVESDSSRGFQNSAAVYQFEHLICVFPLYLFMDSSCV